MLNITDIILSCVSIILTALATWGIKKLTDWLNIKIEDSKLKNILNDAIDTITNIVKAVYQTYVESLKDQNLFDKNAQEEALKRAMEQAKLELSEEIKVFLENNKIDVDSWLKTQIESIIYNLKNKQ